MDQATILSTIHAFIIAHAIVILITGSVITTIAHALPTPSTKSSTFYVVVYHTANIFAADFSKIIAVLFSAFKANYLTSANAAISGQATIKKGS